MAWKDNLQACTWGDITFAVENTTDALTRRLARYDYPYRDGADFEDLGREPRSTRFRAHFHSPTYETDLGALLLEADAGKARTFTHPVLGQWTARLQVRGIDHSADYRDGCIVDVELLEDGTDAELDTVFSVSALSDAVGSASTDLAAAVPSGVYAGVKRVTVAVADATSRAQAIKAAVDKTVLEVERRKSEVRQAVRDVIAAAKAVYPPNVAGQLVAKAQALGREASQLADAVRLTKPAARSHTTSMEGPATLLIYEQGGPGASLDEFLSGNRIRNPNRVPAGETVAIYQPKAE